MRYFWNPVTGHLVRTRNKRTIALLLLDNYIEIDKKRYDEIALEDYKAWLEVKE